MNGDLQLSPIFLAKLDAAIQIDTHVGNTACFCNTFNVVCPYHAIIIPPTFQENEYMAHHNTTCTKQSHTKTWHTIFVSITFLENSID